MTEGSVLESRPAWPPRPGILATFAIVLVLAAYLPVLGGPFIWDDFQLAVDAPRITELRPLSEYFGSAFWLREDVEPGGRTYYRPLTILSLALDHRLHGTNPGGYHLTNLVLHALNTWLVFVLLRRRRASGPVALVGSLAWGLFPRLTEAAAWISGRTDVLAATFVLVALAFASAERPALRRSAAALVLAGMLAKEVAVSGLIALAGIEWLRSRGQSLPRRLLALWPPSVAGVVYLAMRLWAIGPAVRSSGLSAGDRALAALEALGRYGAMLVDALRPNIQQGYLGVSSWPYVAAGVVVAVLLALGAVRVLRQSDDALEVGSWLTFLCALGLVLHLVPITVNVVAADRFAYLPFAALIVGTLPALAARLPRARSVAAAALVIVASFGVVTFARCHVWADEVTFWTRAFHGKATFDTMSRVELGNVYFRAGMHRHALALYLDADEGDYFNHVMAMHNAGNALLLGGRYADARRLLSQVVEREPNTPKFRVALAVAHIANLDFDSASREIDRALALYPTFEDARQLKRALPKVRDSVSRLTAPPRDNPERLTYAQIFAELERHPDAFQLLKEALRRPAPERPGVSDLRRSVLYALQFADVATLREVFESYEHHTADPPLAGIRHAVRERFERVERLRALWPSLGVPLR